MVRGLGLFGLLAVASCNALVGFGTLQKVDDDPSEPKEKKDGASQRSDASASRADGAAEPRCDKTAPFGPAVPLSSTVNTTAHETAPTLTADELTILFQRTADLDGGNLLIATRSSPDEPFGEPREIDELGVTGVSYAPTITPDGLVLFWIEFNKTTSPFQMDVFTAIRTTPSARFERPREFSEVNSLGDEFAPFVTSNGTELWFTSDRDGTSRIFRSVRDPDTDEFGPPKTVPEMNKFGGRFFLSADGLAIYFSGSGANGEQDTDLFEARRAQPTAAFGEPVSLGEVNSPTHDGSPWVSPDECRIYFASSRNGGKDDIYVASRGR